MRGKPGWPPSRLALVTIFQKAEKRRARYRGLPKTRPGHVYMACALNLIRLHTYWTGTPLDQQRTSHLARLELGLAA